MDFSGQTSQTHGSYSLACRFCLEVMKNILRMLSLLSPVGFCFSGLRLPVPTSLKRFKRGYLLWGSDQREGPLYFPDPKDPSKLIGFEVDLAEEIARTWRSCEAGPECLDSLIPALKRGDSDIAMNGIEITPEGKRCFFPAYYIFTEQLVVSKDEAG